MTPAPSFSGYGRIQNIGQTSLSKQSSGHSQAAGKGSHAPSGTKRPIPKLLSVSTLTSPKKARAALPNDAAIEWCWYKYGDNARLYFDRMPANTLFLGLLKHSARPGVLWKFNIYLEVSWSPACRRPECSTECCRIA